jgi:Fic family protein
MLYQSPDLTADDEAVLELIRRSWMQLRFNLQHHPMRWTGLLARTLRARAIQGSNSIEGFVVSREDALAVVDGDEPEEADPDSAHAVSGYRDALSYVLRLANAPDFTYTKDLLRSLHFMMTRHDVSANPGTWRPGAVYVRNDQTGEVVHEGPSADQVPDLTQELAVQLTGADEDASTRMIRAAMAHLNLVMVHPFSDGNGRMSRCLQTLVLARGGVLDPTFSSIEEYLGRNTQAYYDVLAEVGGGSWNPERDALPWIRFCLTAHYRQAKSAERRLLAIADIGSEVEVELNQRKLPDRAAVALVNTALGERLRNSAYRHHAGVSALSASRDLKSLADSGLLIAEGAKRGRSYRAGPWLQQCAARHRHTAPIEDPYDRPHPT